MAERERREAHAWLELVERSGLVVGEVPLHRNFPDGPGAVEVTAFRHLVGRWERYRVDPDDATRRRIWDATVLHDLLGWPGERLFSGADVPESCRVRPDDVEETLAPAAVLGDGRGGIHLGLWHVPADQGLDRVERKPGRWRATPQAKVERWMRGAGVRVALLTNGTRFRLIHVPEGLPAGWMEFDAGQWMDERATLAGFVLLLHWDRVCGRATPDLAALLAESEKEQTDLTDRLGEQVRNAVEDLLLALDRADAQQGGKVLEGIPEDRLYEAAVFVVMRLVFLLFAEERSLLPHGNVFYDEAYGVGRLLHTLQEERLQRPDTFARERDAWPRLLALFRLVFHGSAHPDLTLPAYGGDLFDPEGTGPMKVLEDPRLQLPNVAVYRVLRSLTVGEAKVGREKLAQRFSYRTLDVEHIGYVYEGLLDHRAAWAGAEPMVKLRNGSEQAYALSLLESKDEDALVRFLKDEKTFSGSEDRIRAALAEAREEDVARLQALSPDTAARCRPYAGVLQVDEVAEPGRLYLTTAASRRATGTHYTPIQYTRAMVRETLDPLVYVGEHGKLEEPLRLRSPRELLALKVGDPAMGSGAFLVQVVRYMGEKLTDAWYAARAEHGEGVPLYLPYAEAGKDREDRIPLPAEREEAETWARRFVAERCIYGVDKNALAAEMAKLSVWLVTLSRDKPFSFLDHALRSGDSLVGLSSLDQLRTWSLDGEGDDQVFAEFTARAVEEAMKLRKELEAFPVTDPSDVEHKRRLLAAADEASEQVRALGDLLFGPHLASAQPARQRELLDEGLFEATKHLDDVPRLRRKAETMLGELRPFHWPLEFPEVFEEGGFDALVGNPPFMGGKKLLASVGHEYREFLVEHLARGTRGSADLVAYFFLRAHGLLREGGCFGLLAVNTISEGDTRQVGLDQLLRRGATIFSAHPNEPWPNAAAVVTSRVHVRRGPWKAACNLSGANVGQVSAFLTQSEDSNVWALAGNVGVAFIGSYVLGTGFLVDDEEAERLRHDDSRNAEVLFPFLNGQDLNQHPGQRASRWAICFWDWPERRARTYGAPFHVVRERVWPQRKASHTDGRSTSSRRYVEYWWQYGRPVPGCYHAIGRGHAFEKHPEGWDSAVQPLGRVIATSSVTKYWAPSLVPNTPVFSHALVLFASDSPAFLALLLSCVHAEWAWKQASTLETRLRYTPSDCFETFPLPVHGELPTDAQLDTLGTEFHELRRAIMKREWVGLTDLYNRLHDPDDTTEGLDRLRELQVAIDRRVLELYGWSDIPLDHDFRDVTYLPENDRRRFAISEEARLELLDRLGRLNRERHEEEVAAAAAEQAARPRRQRGAGRASARRAKPEGALDLTAARAARDTAQPSLFEVPPAPVLKAAEPSGPPAPPLSHPGAILSWLRDHPGWHGRATITEATGVPQAAWNTAIRGLQDAELVERTGEKRGTRYRAVPPVEEEKG